jgi:hypothetical protein
MSTSKQSKKKKNRMKEDARRALLIFAGLDGVYVPEDETVHPTK